MGTTNVTPAHIDPRRLFVDVESLLGRAAAIGMQTVDLPPTFGDALMAWLRARALGFAQQQRTGIALGRDLLRRGVVRAWTCVDEGLRTVTSENLETAVERLAAGELTLLYSEGYERIFAQLERLRDSSSSWLHDETTLALLPGADMALRRWSRIVPESWTVPSQDGGEDVAIEPQAELLQFGELNLELNFALSLPRQATRELISTEPDFAGGLPLLLLRVWLALVLGVPGLTVDADAIAAFRVRFTDGALDAGATADALTALDEHLARAFEDSAPRQTLRDAALLELAKLAEASATGRDFSLYLREMLVPDDAESARLDAERDAEPDCV